jgi:hypothetical protein
MPLTKTELTKRRLEFYRGYEADREEEVATLKRGQDELINLIRALVLVSRRDETINNIIKERESFVDHSYDSECEEYEKKNN